MLGVSVGDQMVDVRLGQGMAGQGWWLAMAVELQMDWKVWLWLELSSLVEEEMGAWETGLS